MGISISGLGSGFDWQSIVSQLQTVEEQRLTPLNTRKTQEESKLSAWETLGSKLSTLKTAVTALKTPDALKAYSTSLTSSSSSVSADSLLSISTGTGAVTGSYNITVEKMAKAEKIQSNSVTSQTAALGWTGTLTMGPSDTVIELDSSWSLQDIQDAINEKNTGTSATGVTASILQVADNDFRLILTSDNTGEIGTNLTDAANDYFQDTPLQQGQNALLTIDGISISRESNTIDDAIEGVTLSVKGASTGTNLTLAVQQDSDAISTKVQSFVDAYNGVLDYFSKQMTYSSDTNTTGGVLFGDNSLKAIRNSLRNVMGNAGLSELGITVGSDNRLELDTSALEEALRSDGSATIGKFNTMAQNLDSVLDNLTDSEDGTLTRKQENIQDNIDGIEKKISTTQESIDRRIEMYTKQYSALATTLNEMATQSEWIESQLSYLS